MAVREMENFPPPPPPASRAVLGSDQPWALFQGRGTSHPAFPTLKPLLVTGGTEMSGALLELGPGLAEFTARFVGFLVDSPESSVTKAQLFLIIICCCQQAGSVWVGVTEGQKSLCSPHSFS